MGDFNAWSTTATPMQRVYGGWERSIELMPGRHAYAYLVVHEPPGDAPYSVIACGGSELWVPEISTGEEVGTLN
jgi:hypothetical protein